MCNSVGSEKGGRGGRVERERERRRRRRRREKEERERGGEGGFCKCFSQLRESERNSGQLSEKRRECLLMFDADHLSLD